MARQPDTSPARTELVCEIMALAYFISAHTPLCVFIDYSGHIDDLDIQVCESKEGWRNEIARTKFATLYSEKYLRKPHGYLLAIRDVLRETLETHEVPYWHERMERVVNCCEHYEF